MQVELTQVPEVRDQEECSYSVGDEVEYSKHLRKKTTLKFIIRSYKSRAVFFLASTSTPGTGWEGASEVERYGRLVSAGSAGIAGSGTPVLKALPQCSS